MEQNLSDRAKEIIQKILYITIASASKEAKPWNTPVFSAYDENYNFFWASDQNGQHSINIRENSEVFLVIYDSTAPSGTGEGVYIKAKAYELTNEDDINHALVFLDGRDGNKPQPATNFLNDMPRRIYKAIPEKFWMNGDGDVNGNYIDIRIEVNLK